MRKKRDKEVNAQDTIGDKVQNYLRIRDKFGDHMQDAFSTIEIGKKEKEDVGCTV